MREFGVDQIFWSSPVGDLDVSILTLKGDVSALPIIPCAEQIPPTTEHSRVFIISHPHGGPLCFSLDDNRLVDSNEHYLHYRTATETGSSGGPVLDNDWQVVAVHHKRGSAMARLTGEGVHEANQGSSILAIRDRFRKNPPKELLQQK